MFRSNRVIQPLAVLAFLALLFVGCSDQLPTAPGPNTVTSAAPIDGEQPSFQADGQSLAGRYIVVLEDTPEGSLESKVLALGGSVTFSHPIGLAVVSGLSEEAAAELGGDEGVAEIFQDVSYPFDAPLEGPSTAAAAGIPFSPEDPASAYFFPLQWNLEVIGAPQVWAEGRLGSPGVTVAILDSGIDYLHPDLDGLVDLTRSISFMPDDDELVETFFPGRHPVTDLLYHGTHVASTVVSNGELTAGVTSQITLIGVKVCDAYGSCPLGAVLSGVLYASDNGADVMNLSLGDYFAKPELAPFVGLVNRIFNYVGSKGATVVVAAGNDERDLDHDGNGYAAYCSAPNTICVSATGPVGPPALPPFEGPWEEMDTPAPYTNFGRSAINVAAPGGTVAGWIWGACTQTSIRFPYMTACSDPTILGLAGTSMAAPQVSGLAALLVEEVGRRPGRVKTMIQRGADDLGRRGTDPYYGKGRINFPATVSH